MNAAPPALSRRQDPAVCGAIPTVAVIGARDSGTAHLTALLEQHLADRKLFVLTTVGDGATALPDQVLFTVNAVCPIRPDDLTVLTTVARRLPVTVILVHPDRSRDIDETVSVTTERIRAAVGRLPVHVLATPPETSPRPSDMWLTPTELIDHVASTPAQPSIPPTDSGAPRPSSTAPTTGVGAMTGAELVEWLVARRTELITARSAALRQDVQALRMTLLQDLQRRLRALLTRARQEIGDSPARSLDSLMDELSSASDQLVVDIVARTDRLTDALVARHLALATWTAATASRPSGELEVFHPPRHRTEESLMLFMGAAGGTGVGRMILTPLADVPTAATAIVPLSLLAGLLLGIITVVVRRSQTRRAHLLALTGESIAALRAELEQAISSRLLAAEAQIVDGFAHDPGPRVADVERRIRAARPSSSTKHPHT